MLDDRRTEYRHDNRPTNHVCIDPRGGVCVRACVRGTERESRARERRREENDACRGLKRESERRGRGRKRLNEERVNLDVEHHSDD